MPSLPDLAAFLERVAGALGSLIAHVETQGAAIDRLSGQVRDLAEAVRDNTAATRALQKPGPVETSVSAIRRIDRRTLLTLVVLGVFVGFGVPGMLWLTGQALHDSPELVTTIADLVRRVWP